MAPPEVAPIGTRSTIGQENAPLDRQRMVAASLFICCMAGQM